MDNLRDGLPYPYTENDAEGFIKAMLSADKDKTFAFAITADEKVIGSIGVFRGEHSGAIKAPDIELITDVLRVAEVGLTDPYSLRRR